MNKQRQILVTITYNDLGIIIDTKVEPLKQVPSAQPEIIRCKDCANWDRTWTNDFAPDYHYCPMIDGVRKKDFFCADAEKIEEMEE